MPNQDVTAPTLLGLTLPRIDVSSGSQTATFTASATDDLSGVSKVYLYLDHALETPSGSQNYIAFDVPGGFAGGSESVSQVISASTDPGIYNVIGAQVIDNAGNSVTYLPNQLEAMGVPDSFVVQASSPPPPVTAVVNAPTSFQEGTASNFDVTLTLKGVTTLSGTAGLAYDPVSTAQQGVSVIVPSATPAFHLTQAQPGDVTLDLGQITVLNDGEQGPPKTIVLDVTAPAGFDFANGTSETRVVVSLLAANDLIFGTASGETITGTAHDDHIIAGGGNDIVVASSGTDIIDGGDGTDRFVLAGFAHDYTFSLNTGAGTISGGREALSDTLTSIENVQFTDGTLTFDPQSTTAEIVRLYDSFLGRAPDPAGFESYLRYVAAGHTLQDMAANAAASPEFANATAGLNDTQYVTYVYEHSLHREPDPGGLQTYVADLENGTFTRTSLILQAAESPEHVALTAGVVGAGLWVPNETVEGLELLYDAAVQRQPDPTGLSGYGQLLAQGTTFRQIANQMASSAEFMSAHAGQTDAQYVASLYVAELGRHADPTGLAAYTSQLANGYSRGDILYETAFSQEHQSHVLAFYDPLLGT